MSGEKYWAKRQDILLAMGPDCSIWDDLPSQPDEVESSSFLLCEGSARVQGQHVHIVEHAYPSRPWGPNLLSGMICHQSQMR